MVPEFCSWDGVSCGGSGSDVGSFVSDFRRLRAEKEKSLISVLVGKKPKNLLADFSLILFFSNSVLVCAKKYFRVLSMDVVFFA